MPDYSSVPEMAYDWVIVLYFFLGGLSAGAFLFSLAANHWREELRPLGKIPAILAPIALAVGMLALLLHLGKPFRAWRLFVAFNPRSALSWGVWFLNLFLVLSLLYAWNLLKGNYEKAKRFGYLGAPFAVLVATYTGVLLTQAPGRPLWHTPLLPVVFLNGALISGTALALLVSAGRRDRALLAGVGRLLAGLVVLELCLIAIELIVLLQGGGEGMAAALALLTGRYALHFMGLVVVLGAVIPVIILMQSKASAAAQAIASLMVLIGVFTMRYVVVVGGQVLNW
jgi:formate-dependent nitrite reductase membrane component NrfD